MPNSEDLDLSGLAIDAADLDELLQVDVAGWLAEVPMIREYYEQFGAKLPRGLVAELDELEERLRSAS